jgi:hypothetical protein
LFVVERHRHPLEFDRASEAYLNCHTRTYCTAIWEAQWQHALTLAVDAKVVPIEEIKT